MLGVLLMIISHDRLQVPSQGERRRCCLLPARSLLDAVTTLVLCCVRPQVPQHCMWDVVGEFIAGPEVAYTQHYTTPFDEQCRNYWEQHISAFTRIIYFQGIAMSVAFGDCAPLVGHNAFLRWASVKKVGWPQDAGLRHRTGCSHSGREPQEVSLHRPP